MIDLSSEHELALKKKISSLSKQLLKARAEKKAIKEEKYRLKEEEYKRNNPDDDDSQISVRGRTRFAEGATCWRSAYTSQRNIED